MASLLLEPVYWNWFLLGLVLIIVEIFAPGTFLLWIGVAALGMGGLLIVFPEIGWKLQCVIFALLSMSSIGAWWLYAKRHPYDADEFSLNRRGHQYVGRVFTLDNPIVNSQGRLRVDDSSWKVEGTDCSVGTRVRVTGVKGVVLQVEIEQS